MIFRICEQCKRQFQVYESSLRKSAGRYCSMKCRRQFYSELKADGLTISQRSYRKHRDERRRASREYYANNKDKEKERRIRFKKEHPEKVIAWNRRNDARPERRASKAELERTEKRKATRRRWKENNIEYYKEFHSAYERAYRWRRKELHDEKQANDPQYRLRRTLRSSLKNAIKKSSKNGSAIKNLGCSIEELKIHLERLWQNGMNWNNFGRLGVQECTWQIDHVIPLSSFDLTDPKQIALACHWTNLAPLWAIDNRRKGKRIDSREAVSNAF